MNEQEAALRYIDAELTQYLESMPADETSRKLRDSARSALPPNQTTAEIDARILALVTPAQGADARPVAMTNGSFHCPACGETMKGPLACGHCLWQKPEAVDAEIGADGIDIRDAAPSVGAISDADKSDREWLDLSERIKAETPNIFGGYMKFIGNFARAVLATRDATPTDSAEPKCRICGHKWHCGQCVNLHPDREPKS